MPRPDPRGLALRLLYSRWRRPAPIEEEEGYTVLLPIPSDMPFLLRFGLEGLAGVDTTGCRQVVVVPDGTVADSGPLRAVLAESADSRIELVEPHAADRPVIRALRGNGSGLHWMAIVNGTERARGEHIFLHDADAFFAEADGLERQHRECRGRGLATLGVTPRWDPAYAAIGYTIPATWEMMYSNRWARGHRPADLKGRDVATPHGVIPFDTMLYPQYLDYPSGRIGVMAEPPRFVHFNGTIVTYRVFRSRGGGPVIDELFRILLLAILEELLPAADGRRALPPVAELARGLGDPSARVRYDGDGSAREYPTFRRQLGELCAAPIFRGDRAGRIAELIRPFDDHFAGREPVEPVGADAGGVRMRGHGLG